MLIIEYMKDTEKYGIKKKTNVTHISQLREKSLEEF